MAPGRNFEITESRAIFFKLLSLVKSHRPRQRLCLVSLTRSSCARWCPSLFLGVLMQPLIAESTDLFLTDSPLREGLCCSVTRKVEAFKATGNANGLHLQRPLKSMPQAEET